MDQIMKVLYIKKKGPKLNTLERFYIRVYDMTKRGLQMNNTFTDMHNPIFDILIKTQTQITPSHHHPQHQSPTTPYQ
jgi:hypothetical protein